MRAGGVGHVGADQAVFEVPVIDGVVQGVVEALQGIAVVIVGVKRLVSCEIFDEQTVVGVVAVVGQALGGVVAEEPVAHGVVTVVDRAIAGDGVGDGLGQKPVERIVAVIDVAAGVFSDGGALAGGIERVAIAGDYSAGAKVFQEGQAVQRVVLPGLDRAVGQLRADQVTDGIVGVVGHAQIRVSDCVQ